MQSEFDEPRILRSQVLKYQKIEWDGVEYYLTSPVEMINAQQLWLPSMYMRLLYSMASKKHMAKMDAGELEAGLDELFAYLCELIGKRYPRYGGLYGKLMDAKCWSRYSGMILGDKMSAVAELLALLHCNASYGLKAVGLAGEAGRMKNINFGGSISDIVFVDTSVTGMFERRSTIEP